jgi:hypothetical protein
MKTQALYLNSHQSRKREPTQYENLLGDALERAFAAGHWELAALIAQLNLTGPRAPNGETWSEALFLETMQQLEANA